MVDFAKRPMERDKVTKRQGQIPGTRWLARDARKATSRQTSRLPARPEVAKTPSKCILKIKPHSRAII
jgi:hypothetical protein